MLNARLIFVFGLVLTLVNAKSILPAEDDWEFDFLNDLVDLDEYSPRMRRDVDDEKEPSDRENSSEFDPPPPPPPGFGPPGASGECSCPPPPPPPPPPFDRPGHYRRPPNPCQGLDRDACYEKMAAKRYDGPPCELRLFFRLPVDFNHTARRECFDKWEKSALEEKGFDFSKPLPRIFMRPHFQRTLMVHKGCDTQCMFLENKLVNEEGDSVAISKDAVMAALKEDEDPQEMTDIFEQQIDKCLEEASDLVHSKQSCKSGSDEFLGCMRLNINNACPGAKWKGKWWGARTPGNKTNRLDVTGFRDGMSSLLDMSDSNTLDNLFVVMDRNGRRYIGAETWLKGMSTLCLGNTYEKSSFCWQAYDIRGEGQLTRNQMMPLIRRQFASIQLDDLDGVCKEFIDLVLKDTKAGKEGFITMNEYLQLVEKRPLYREMFGQVLPSRLSMETFMSTFQPPDVTKSRR